METSDVEKSSILRQDFNDPSRADMVISSSCQDFKICFVSILELNPQAWKNYFWQYNFNKYTN